MAMFKKAAGVAQDKMVKNMMLQREDLPDSGIAPDNNEYLEMIRDYLWTKDLERINGSKHMPLYPMFFKDEVCTGEPLLLMRVCNRMKMDKKTGEDIQNPNYGRFFFAAKVPRIEDGQEVMNDKGYPILDLDQFSWVNESQFAKSGALKKVAETLESLLLETFGVDLTDAEFWPEGLVAFLTAQ